jgi:hypothetical protein
MSHVSIVNENQQEFGWNVSKFDISLISIFLLLLYPLSINHTQALVISCLIISLFGAFIIVIFSEALFEGIKFDKKNRFNLICKYCLKNYIYSIACIMLAFMFPLSNNFIIFGSVFTIYSIIGMFATRYYQIALIVNVLSLLFLSYYAFSINNEGITYIDFSDNSPSVRITQEELPYFNFNVLNTKNIDIYKETEKVEKNFSDKQLYLSRWTIIVSAESINLERNTLKNLDNFSKIRNLPEDLLADYNPNINKRGELLKYFQGKYPNLVFSIDKLEYLELNTIVL